MAGSERRTREGLGQRLIRASTIKDKAAGLAAKRSRETWPIGAPIAASEAPPAAQPSYRPKVAVAMMPMRSPTFASVIAIDANWMAPATLSMRLWFASDVEGRRMRYGSVGTIRSNACHLVVRSHCVFATVAVADQVADREHDGERYKTFEHWIVEHHCFSH